jgi:hypothetical protein
MKPVMNKFDKVLRILNSILGLLSMGAFITAGVVLINLRPKMVAFDPLSALEENLMTGVGFGLVLILGFFLLSLLQIVRAVRDADHLGVFPLILIILGVLAALFVFSDVALLMDIHKQYLHGWAQPEWSLVLPIMAVQFLLTILLTVLHVSGYFLKIQHKRVVRDVNIFLIVHYVGVVCGLMGLGLTSLGFFYPSAWSLPTHTIMGSLTLIFPYALVVIYWLAVKLREKERVWWDEKQVRDVGQASMVTLALDTLLMLGLFAFNLQDLGGVVRLIWLPLYLFATITFFSAGNLYFSQRI